MRLRATTTLTDRGRLIEPGVAFEIADAAGAVLLEKGEAVLDEPTPEGDTSTATAGDGADEQTGEASDMPPEQQGETVVVTAHAPAEATLVEPAPAPAPEKAPEPTPAATPSTRKRAGR